MEEKELTPETPPSALIADPRLIHKIYGKYNEGIDFAQLLFKFFDCNNEAKKLMDHVIDVEVKETATAMELFRVDSLATKLLNIQFLSEVGKKYLTNTMLPTIQKVAETPFKEFEREAGVSASDVENNIKWYLEILSSLIKHLRETVPLCPNGLRLGFLSLLKIASSKFSEVPAMVRSLIFLRFLCPSLIDPTKLSLVKDALPADKQRSLRILSRILQQAANNSEIKDAKIGNPGLINAWIASVQDGIDSFVQALIDEEDITKGYKILKGSSRNPSQFLKLEASEHLNDWILKHYWGRNIEEERKFADVIRECMDVYVVDETTTAGWWKVKAAKKKGDSWAYGLRPPGCDIITWKYGTWIRVSSRDFYDWMVNVPYEVIDSTICKVEREEFHDHIELHTFMKRTAGNLVKPRDMTVSRYISWDEAQQQGLSVSFSVVREKWPPVKGFIRGHIQAHLNIIDRDPENPNCCYLTVVTNADPKGKIPHFLLTAVGTACLKVAKSYKKMAEEHYNVPKK